MILNAEPLDFFRCYLLASSDDVFIKYAKFGCHYNPLIIGIVEKTAAVN
jgi:hypothetical protein